MSSSESGSDGGGASFTATGGHGHWKGEELIVEKVLNRRLNKAGQAEYFIQWEGHGDQNNSWEREENLNCPDKIEEFEWARAARKDMERAAVIISSRRGAGATSEGQQVEHGNVEEGISTTSTLSKEIHPLLTSVILTNLFNICPHEDLRNCQLVCRAWHENSLTTWRSTSTIVLKFYLKNKQHICLLPAKECKDHHQDQDGTKAARTSLSQFLDFCEQECAAKPYRQFHLGNWTFPSSSSPSTIQGEQDRFLDVVGQNVTLLKLSNCRFVGGAEDLLKFLCQSWPRLRSLILEDFTCISPTRSPEKMIPSGSEYMEPVWGQQINLKSLSFYTVQSYSGLGSPIPISSLELLSHFPSLTTLNVSATSYDLLHSLLQAIQVIRRHDGRKLPLRSIGGFHLTSRMGQAKSQEIRNLFQELNLGLDYLAVDYSTKLEDFHSLLLSETGRTICQINAVKFSGTGRRQEPRETRTPNYVFPCQFPFGVELTNLQTLIMSCTFSKNMEFLKWTPNLVKLHLSPYGKKESVDPSMRSNIIANTGEADMANVKLAKLKELFMGYVVTVDAVSKLGRWIPNLEILSMFLTDEHFAIVCDQWRGLTHLHQLGGPNLHDKGVTGMGWDDDKIRPNITMLKNLHCFQYARQRYHLTDDSVYNGFLKLPNLRILDIPYTDKNKLISDEAVEALQENIPNCQVRDTERGSRVKTNGPECKYFNMVFKCRKVV